VDFKYPSAQGKDEQLVLAGFNLSIPPNTVCAIVGPSGAGKSTVFSLLERFYLPSAGQVLIDGLDIVYLNPSWLRRQLALVSQEPVLFGGTIRENIAYGLLDGDAQPSDAEVVAAATAANAHGFISSFKEGYDTLVGERGVRLSGGQKQRVAIARALIRQPRVLLLDEATSALDSESEYLVQQAIDAMMQGKERTVLVIAHRLSTVKSADQICVLDDGKAAELGTHYELMAKEGGLFRKLVSRQLTGIPL